VLRDAVSDLSFLMGRGYAVKSALKVVGDRYQLRARQRRAVSGAAGKTLAIDGYNLLIVAESALAGGKLFRGRDGCIRDLASVHGSYRKVSETMPAIRMLGGILASLSPARARWYFDAPVSNSGRLKVVLEDEARSRSLPWEVELSDQVDRVLAECDDVVVTSDGAILDRARRWVNVAAVAVRKAGREEEVLDLRSGRTPEDKHICSV